MSPQSSERRIADDTLNEMVAEYVHGRSYLDRDIPEYLHRSCFFILHWMVGNDGEDLLSNPPSAIYGHVRHQMGYAINGYPMFYKLTLIYKPDFEVFCKRVNRMREAMQAALKED